MKIIGTGVVNMSGDALGHLTKGDFDRGVQRFHDKQNEKGLRKEYVRGVMAEMTSEIVDLLQKFEPDEVMRGITAKYLKGLERQDPDLYQVLHDKATELIYGV